EFRTEVPGKYLLVDHSIFRAFNKGAMAMLKVDGAEVPAIYHATPADAPAEMPAEHEHPMPAPAASAAPAAVAPAAKTAAIDPITHGKQIFDSTCAACHQPTGSGVPGAFPPLAKSDFLAADPKRAVHIVLHGLSGKVTVNGQHYDSMMPPFGPQLSDDDVAHVLTYVLNSWGNPGGRIHKDDVAAARRGGARNEASR
ncbi:MAG TPA: c-type cytochrome, partial [Mizugakiibacter sp.]